MRSAFTPDQYTGISTGAGPSAIAALRSGQIDALVMWDAMLGAAENTGLALRVLDKALQDQPEGARLGEFIKANWENTHAAYVKLGTLKGAEAATDSYTEQVLAACNDFDRAAIVAQANSMGR